MTSIYFLNVGECRSIIFSSGCVFFFFYFQLSGEYHHAYCVNYWTCVFVYTPLTGKEMLSSSTIACVCVFSLFFYNIIFSLRLLLASSQRHLIMLLYIDHERIKS